MLVGATVGAGLAIYATVHEPTGRGLVFVESASVDTAKIVLSALAVALMLAQVACGALAARQPDGAARQLGDLQRVFAAGGFALSLPVVFHCVWALGWPDDGVRSTAHAALGCVAYGSYLVHALGVRSLGARVDRRPPVSARTGVAAAAAMTAAWATVAFSGAA